MSLVYDQPVAGPATHALVIGVGAYTHLPGGPGPIYPKHEGLAQLSSPPHSARQFTTWLIGKYRNPAKPLATVDLLISDDADANYQPPGGAAQPVERATFQNVQTAIRQRWFASGDTDPDNLLILFYCGHGVSRGLMTSLLMEDFANWDQNPLEQAIDFREFHAGMDKCKARWQVYFIDACRKASAALIEDYNNYAGQPIIPGSAKFSPAGVRSAPIYYATAPGQAAYGRVGQPSVFCEALLKSLNGAGSVSVEDDEPYRVYTNTLNLGIDALMRRALHDAEGLEQVASADGLQRFQLHTLDGDPIVPVTLGCKPPEANLSAVLSYAEEGQPNKITRPPDQMDWELELAAGDYELSAEFGAGVYQNKTVRKGVYPPERIFHVEVGA